MKLLWIVAAVCMGATAQSATIEKINNRGNVVVIQLTDEEVAEFEEGEVINIQTRSAGNPIEGQIKRIKGNKAFVKVGKGKGLKKGKKVEVATLGTVFTSSVDVSETAPSGEARNKFRDPVFGSRIVSPAQIYQVRNFRTDFQVALLNDNMGVKFDGFDATQSSTGPEFALGAVKRVSESDLRLGMTASHTNLDVRLEADLNPTQFGGTPNMDLSGRVTETVLAPMAAYTFGKNFTAALTYRVNQARMSGELFDSDHNFNYATPVVGALYHDNTMEAGVSVTAKVDEESKTTDIDGDEVVESIQEPMTATAHGRYQTSPKLAVHGRVDFIQNNAFNKDGADPQKNSAYIEAGTRHTLKGRSFVDLAVFGNTPRYVNDSEKDFTNSYTYGAGADYFFPYKKGNLLGASIRYELLEDSYKDKESDIKFKFKRDTLTLSVQGAIPL